MRAGRSIDPEFGTLDIHNVMWPPQVYLNSLAERMKMDDTLCRLVSREAGEGIAGEQNDTIGGEV